ncbi:hypothetical protein K227x_31830 [Rubripirellula lacrimiformis]|uniref:Glycosyltransferase subfamily 4-like N-terminal domain-containing protein n=1 Tax=Rubripirellula lacrimiformis TaxID=1930273 RepID=A0A517NCF1_9BACT|nr:glycosyltransferase family 4 protein [Rubripirellula lacrimiformis]QDT04786.1 hypothetical protein K227x_31830 [Rubripirellula lacrimiformis]
MNRSVRVLLIGRHFWPHGSFDSAGYMVELATGLHRHGVQVQVCTPRYAATWPETFSLREVSVHRPAAAPKSDWSIGRYTRQLTQWLRQNAASFDVMYVDSIREEAVAAIEAARSTGCPTVLRYAGWGKQSDATYWNTTRSGRRCGSIGKMADAVIAKSAPCSRALLADRYSADRIVRIGPGFTAGAQRTAAVRKEARSSLAAANSDLYADPDAPIAICTAAMTRDTGLTDLVRATRHLVDRYPNLRVWFIGDGPYRDWIYDQLRGDGIRASIAMPGSFCEYDDLYAAADLYLQTDDSGLDHFLPKAVSAELPIVAVRSEAVSSLLAPPISAATQSEKPQDWVRWIDDPVPTAFLAAISKVLDDLPEHQHQASLLRRHWLRANPMTGTIDAYTSLFQRVIEKKSNAKLKHRDSLGDSAESAS